MTKQQVCTRCVMDTTDPEITFDEHGVCNHCHNYDKGVKALVFSGKAGEQKLAALVRDIKASVPPSQKYNCLIGVSGGVDSSYVAYLCKEFGLSPLAFHLDNEWNDPISVKNIEAIVGKLGIDLVTKKVDWNEYRDLQLAFLYASVPDCEVPTDYALNSTFHELATQHNIKYIINGCNIRTESHLPRTWSQGHFDWKYIESVNKRYGHTELKSYTPSSPIGLYMDSVKHKVVSVLNYIDYNKSTAMRVLESRLGWKYYGGKHYESIYTRFYQGYILPKKFGFDKRKMHFSSLICSGEMDRKVALLELEKEPYPLELQYSDLDTVCKKFGISSKEFERIMNQPVKKFSDYDSYTNSTVRNIARTMRDNLIRPFLPG
jgi:N-acetyl sugar amidotransferase